MAHFFHVFMALRYNHQRRCSLHDVIRFWAPLSCFSRRITVFSLFLFGCDTSEHPTKNPVDSNVTAPLGDPATIALTGACPLAQRLGGFVVAVDPEYSIVDGAVLDGVVPVTVLTEVTRVDDCQLLRKENPFCNPACAQDETCDFDGSCLPYPTEQDLGTVSILGLSGKVEMTPLPPGARYFNTQLPHPAFEPGAFIELRAGGWAGDITLHGVGVTPIILGEATWSLRAGEDLPIHWDVPEGLVRSEVQLRLSIDQHGSSPMSLSCVFADDGVGLVPAVLIDGLLAAGISGFPSGVLSRQTADHADLNTGCMDFVVATPRVPNVRVDGSTPCNAQDDCPEGQTCNLELEICE